MVNTSVKFHEAIRNDEPQMPLLIFDKAVMTFSDIDIESGGMHFSETAMNDEDFKPGTCNSAVLDFKLFNNENEWYDFEFGEFKAMLGTRTATVESETDALCHIRVDGALIEGWSKEPFLTFNGQPVSGVGSPVKSMLLIYEKLFAFTDTGFTSYELTGDSLTETQFDYYDVPLFSNGKMWSRRGISISYGHSFDGITTGLTPENNLILFQGNAMDCYEMIPLGVFTAERPVYSSSKTISVESFDRMTRFDEKYDGSIEFPITVSGMVDRIAEICGTPVNHTELVNGELVISEDPGLKEMSYREILSDLAEVTGTFARINRNGELELKWFGEVEMTLTNHDYTECNFGYYTAAPITKVVIRDPNTNDTESGDGDNVIYYQSNPIANALVRSD